MAISLRQKSGSTPLKTLDIRPATREYVPTIIEFWHQEGAKKQFFPEYSVADLLSYDGLLRGLELEDVFLAFSGEELVGTVAAWDQKSFRQSVVRGYNRRLTFLRIPYNVTARVTKNPILRRPGSNLGRS